MDEGTQAIGRVKTVLVFDSEKAVISQIVARRMEQQTDGERLHLRGGVKFSDSVIEHIENMIEESGIATSLPRNIVKQAREIFSSTNSIPDAIME